MSYKCIDVSVFNGDINWKKVKASGITAAIIRVGGRYTGAGTIYRDSKGKTNIKNALAAGIKVGVYFFTNAITVAEAIEEANFTLNEIKGFDITMPVIIDTEINSSSDRLAKITKKQRTACTKAFMEVVKKAGYTPMFYAGYYYLKDRLIESELKSYDFWLAQWTTSPYCSRSYQIWQYSSNGSVPGINHRTDMNIGYVEYWKKHPTPKTKLEEDGILGFHSTVAMQEWMKCEWIDGEIWGQTESQNKYYPALITWKNGKGGSPCIKAMQQYLKKEGYSIGSYGADGVLGRDTIAALQEFLKDKKYSIGTDKKGILAAGTAKALQKYLNKILYS